MKSFIPILLLFVSLTTFSQTQPLTTKDIFSRPYLIGKRPTSPNLSPNGNWIVYRANDRGTDSLYLYLQKTTESKPILLSTDKGASFQKWNDDSQTFIFSLKGSLYEYDVNSNKQTLKLKSAGYVSFTSNTLKPKSYSYFSDNTLTTISENPLVIKENKIQKKDDESVFISGRIGETNQFVYGITSQDSVHQEKVPQWMKESVYTTTSWRGNITNYNYYKLNIDSTKAQPLFKKSFTGYGGQTALSDDGKYFAVSNITMDQHNRYVVLVSLSDLKADTIESFTDTAWVNVNGGLAFTNDSKYVLFTSEKADWNHLYAYDLKNKTKKQLTSGKWEVEWFDLNPNNSSEIFLTGTYQSTDNRQLLRLNIETGKLEQLTTADGVRDNFSISKNGKWIAYTYSNLTDPGDIWLLDVSKKTEKKLTHSVPEQYKKYYTNIPQRINITNKRLNETFATHLFLPKDYDKTKKYPAVIFVHGAGYLQNVLNQFGYGSYWREYLFHQYLAQSGYVVLNIDYHGSQGYGRMNRISVYKDMGGADWEDEVDAAKWLVENGYADQEKIGLYGGSYGGFLTLMGMFKSPDIFKAGAGLRSVANWELYNKWYTEQRLGILKSNKKIYEKCSPITYAEGLKNHLLLLHGMVDSNVLFQDIVQLSDKLIRLNKKFDVMYYPRENHGFTEPENWLHEYEEIENHFGKYLK